MIYMVWFENQHILDKTTLIQLKVQNRPEVFNLVMAKTNKICPNRKLCIIIRKLNFTVTTAIIDSFFVN